MKTKKTTSQTATDSALKALAFHVQRVAEAHARDSKDEEVKKLAHVFFRLAEGCVQCFDNNTPFTVSLQTQLELPEFDLTDEAYSEIE